MRRIAWIVLAGVVALSATGCDNAKRLLGQGKRTPDEFAVYSRAPLSVPPDFGLRPPAPGQDPPQLVSPKDQARSAILGKREEGVQPSRALPKDLSPGMQSLLKSVGADRADPEIRAIVAKETSILAEEDQSLTERIMMWGTPNEYGTVVDANKEAKRLQENQALGQPLGQGETPTISRKRKALLEGLFGK